jgi:radical SAM protein with 4Fe4S-binding SPASM domain
MNPRFRHWLKNLAIKTGSIKLLRKVRDTIAPPARVDYQLLERTGEVPVPTSVTMEVTLACNLHCTMCFQNDYRDRGIAKELGTDGLLQVVGRFPPDIRFAYFLGGEVFLRKGFPRLLEAVDAQGIETFITTNGTRIGPEDWAALNRARHLTGLGFSLDGVGAVHDAIRGHDTYDAIIPNVRRALATQRVYISFVMMESNFRQIPEFAKTMTDLGIKEIGFVHEMYCLAHDVEETRRRLGWTEQDEIMMTVKKTDWKPDSARELFESLAVMPSLEHRLGFVAAFEPPLPAETLPALYDGTIRSTTRLFCRELTNLYLDPSGNVVHCGFLRRKFGNVLEQPIEAIWNSEPIREFRKTLLDGNLLPVCRRCCKLSVWPDGSASLPSQEATTETPVLVMPERLVKARPGGEGVRAREESRAGRP